MALAIASGVSQGATEAGRQQGWAEAISYAQQQMEQEQAQQPLDPEKEKKLDSLYNDFLTRAEELDQPESEADRIVRLHKEGSYEHKIASALKTIRES
jgi:hypothetical protein